MKELTARWSPARTKWHAGSLQCPRDGGPWHPDGLFDLVRRLAGLVSPHDLSRLFCRDHARLPGLDAFLSKEPEDRVAAGVELDRELLDAPAIGVTGNDLLDARAPEPPTKPTGGGDAWYLTIRALRCSQDLP